MKAPRLLLIPCSTSWFYIESLSERTILIPDNRISKTPCFTEKVSVKEQTILIPDNRISKIISCTPNLLIQACKDHLCCCGIFVL